MNWDNIRVFIAIHRYGSLALAAKELGINHSTVLRRIATLEQELHVPLFYRRASGYEITAAGERILDQALIMEKEAHALQRHAAAEETDSASCLCVTMPPVDFLQLMPMLAAFQRLHPDIALDLDAQIDVRNLDTREADVAIRMTNEPPENYVGREILRLPFYLYATKSYVQLHGPFTQISDINDWLIIHTPSMGNSMEPWLQTLNPQARIRMRCNTSAAALEATALGVGACFLPQHLAEQSQDLEQLPLLNFDASVGIWLLTHTDLRHQPRVRKFIDFMRQQLSERYSSYVKNTATA